MAQTAWKLCYDGGIDATSDYTAKPKLEELSHTQSIVWHTVEIERIQTLERTRNQTLPQALCSVVRTIGSRPNEPPERIAWSIVARLAFIFVSNPAAQLAAFLKL